MTDALLFFTDIAKNSGIPEGNVEGNGFSTVDYPANGEASDWMLAKHGIYAMSPELGTKDKATETFFISSPRALKKCLSENYPWMKYTILKLMPRINIQITNIFEPIRRSFEN